MMSILIEQLINITDAIFLGHVGEIELGASALAGIWYLAVYMLGFGFSLGLQVVIARRNGEQHYSETGKTFFQGLFFLSGLAVFLCLFSKLFSPIILSRLIASTEVYHAVIGYLDGRIWGLLFSFPFLALRSFLVGINLGTVVLFSVPCLALVFSRHHPYKSFEHGGSDSRIGEHSGQLAAHISLGHGDCRSSHRIVFCRSVFAGGAGNPCFT